MAMTSATQAFAHARDQLLQLRDDQQAASTEFDWPDLGQTWNWAHDWFDHIATGNDAPALILVEEDGSRTTRTFTQIADNSNRIGRWLSSQGIGKGDSVMVMLGNQVELWETMMALIKIGAVILPTTTALGPDGLADRIERGEVKMVICNRNDATKFGHTPAITGVCVGAYDGWANLHDAYDQPADPLPHPHTRPADRLLLYFTSGTTSLPKLVEHTHQSYPVGHLTTMYWLGLQPSDVHLNISSPGWAKHAWSCFFAPWNAGATVAVYNYQHFDPTALLDQMEALAVTTFCAPPTVWRMLINADISGRQGVLREVVSAGEPLNPEVINQVENHWGLTIRDGYGQTETTAQVGNSPGSVVRPGSMGLPLPGMPVVLVDPITHERIDGPGEGEVCLDLGQEPLGMMRGYVGDPNLSQAAFAGGYYHTGDVASRDADGYITFIGRSDDVFKSSDYKISPFELESILLEHPAVSEAAVVPAPDPVRLTVPKAYVSLVDGHAADAETAKAILGFARKRIDRFQRVRRLEFFDELPKTVSGKIRRVELRTREGDQDGTRIEGEYRDSDFPDITQLGH